MNEPQKTRRQQEGDSSRTEHVPRETNDSHSQRNKSPENGDDKQHRSYFSRVKQGWKQTVIGNKLIVLFTLAIAVSNVFYAIYSQRQWRAIRESTRISRESNQAIQRAFVRWDNFSLTSAVKRRPNGDEEYLEVTANWENSGTTPAIGVKSYFHVGELPSVPDGEVFMGIRTSPKNTTYIGPKGRLSQSDTKPLSFYTGRQRIAAVTATEEFDRQIFFWGWIVYKDVFPDTKPHLAEFCQQLVSVAFGVPPGTKTRFPPPPMPNISMHHQSCEQHNCVDEYCSDYGTLVKRATESPN